MEGNPPSTDYAAILADMEAKYAILGNAITSLRALLSIGVVGPVGDLSLPGSAPAMAAPGGASISLPRGAFLGKKIPEAIKLYLSAVRKTQTNKEIAQALRDGGAKSTGKFDNLITGALFQLKNKGIVLRFEDGWGLAEWYPESFRTRVVEKAANGAKRKHKKKVSDKARKASEKTTSKPPQPQAEGLEQRIEKLFHEPAMKGAVSNAVEIATHLSVNRGAVGLALGRMAAKHKLEKTEGGYRLSTGNVQQMPAAKAS